MQQDNASASRASSAHLLPCACKICGYQTESPDPRDLGTVRGNTARFLERHFHLWGCPECRSIHALDPVDFRDIYSDYALSKRRLDVFARGTLRNLLKRLERAGVRKTDAILDYGCGTGLFVRFLNQSGFSAVTGYDPYVGEFDKLPADRLFDCVIANDVIEHVADPRSMVHECASLVRPGGLLYIGTADAEGVEMDRLDSQIMRLHQPFHRIILTRDGLTRLGAESGFELVRGYRRSYMDTWIPFANYRFLDEFNGALGHNLDLALNPSAASIVARKPSLLLYAFFGYLAPSAYEPALVLRKPQ